MKYKNNHICTKDQEIVIGQQYDYSEDGQRMRVLVLEDNSDKEAVRFKLKMLTEPKGVTFDFMATYHGGYYNGMGRLWDAGEYFSGEFSEEDDIPEGQLIGYSLSNCVAQIARNNIFLDRIVKIIAGTAAKDEAGWDRLIQAYTTNYWYPYGDKGEKITRQLLKDGKIFQPRIGHAEQMKSGVVWEKA